MTLDELCKEFGLDFGDPTEPAPDAIFETKIMCSKTDYRKPWSVTWRDPITSLTACAFFETKVEAQNYLSKFPSGPKNALWLVTDED